MQVLLHLLWPLTVTAFVRSIINVIVVYLNNVLPLLQGAIPFV